MSGAAASGASALEKLQSVSGFCLKSHVFAHAIGARATRILAATADRLGTVSAARLD
jgi:hypothetical protein